MQPYHAATITRSPAREAIRARAAARAAARRMPEPEIIEGEMGDWLADAAFSFLAAALSHYAETDSFRTALDDADDFAKRRTATGEIAFQHFDARLSGSLGEKRAKAKFAGITAARLSRDVVNAYCDAHADGPQRAQLASGATMLHMSTTRVWGDRVIRHVCHDTTTIDRATGMRLPAATLILRPLPPPLLVLRDPVEMPEG